MANQIKYIIYGTDNRLTYSPHYYHSYAEDSSGSVIEWGYKKAYRYLGYWLAEWRKDFLARDYPHMTFHIQEIHE